MLLDVEQIVNCVFFESASDNDVLTHSVDVCVSVSKATSLPNFNHDYDVAIMFF